MATTTPPSRNPWLRMGALPRAIGIVLVVVGGVWVLQGIGVAQGSVMSGNAIWAVIGGVLVIAGAVVLRRALNAAKAAIEADREEPEPS
jgi:hypothetical protein